MTDLLKAKTEWIETDHGKRLRWTCPDCNIDILKERRHSTIRCPECNKLMQSENYDVDPKNPDPQNPEWYLEEIAEKKGLPKDYYKEDKKPQDALSW